jgi:hypothetical protein
MLELTLAMIIIMMAILGWAILHYIDQVKADVEYLSRRVDILQQKEKLNNFKIKTHDNKFQLLGEFVEEEFESLKKDLVHGRPIPMKSKKDKK